MIRKVLKNFCLLVASLVISIILCILVSELVFFMTNGNWYKNKSYLLYKSRYDNPAKYLYDTDPKKAFLEEYRPIMIEEIDGEFNISELQNKEIIDNNFRDLHPSNAYDIVVSMWVKCAEPENVKFYLESNNKVKNSVLVDENVIENGYTLFLVISSFNGKSKIWVENEEEVTNCKDLKIFLKRHGGQYNYKKLEDTYRIIVLGGSTTAAYRDCNIWDTYPLFFTEIF